MAVAALSVPCYADSEALLLLQRKAKHIVKLVKKDARKQGLTPLPDVAVVLERPHSVLTSMNSLLETYQNQLAAAQTAANQAVTSQRATFVARLKRIAERNHEIDSYNKRITNDAMVVRRHNHDLRDQATKLSRENDVLLEDVVYIKANITMAQEFITKSLDDAKARIESSADISVLDELAAEDAQSLRADKLMEFAGMGSYSMLQLESQARSRREIDLSQPVDADSHNLVQELKASMDELTYARNDSEIIMKSRFEKEYTERTREQEHLLTEQSTLNSTLAAEKILEQQLEAALGHLQTTHENLMKKSDAIRLFAQRLGARPVPSAGQAVKYAKKLEDGPARGDSKASDAARPKKEARQDTNGTFLNSKAVKKDNKKKVRAGKYL